VELEILGYIYLTDTDHDLEDLHQQLRALYKPNYKSNQKIVVIHNDHEYFFPGANIGVTTYNFFKLVRHVDIPLHVFTIFSTHSRYQQSVEYFVNHDLDRPEIHSLLISDLTYSKIRPWLSEPVNLHKRVKFNALCLLGTARAHRMKLAQYLKIKNYDSVQYNYNNQSAQHISKDRHALKFIDQRSSELSSLGLIYTIPHRMNQDWADIPRHAKFEQLANQPVPVPVKSQHIPNSGIKFYENYAVDIVVETNFDYPHVFISEKTLRTLLSGTAFLMFGPAGTLEYLRNLGFETFGDIWDESYDTIVDAQERFIACLRIVDLIALWPPEQAQAVANLVKNRTEKNQKLLLDYIDNTFKPVYNKFNIPEKK
jgi:hypothetical protein